MIHTIRSVSVFGATMSAQDVLRHVRDSIPSPMPATLAVHDWVGTDASCGFTDAAGAISVRVTPTADFGLAGGRI